MALPNEPILPLPTPPDFLLCDRAYGSQLSTLDCLLAANENLMQGSSSISWQLGGRPPFALPRLPQTYWHGSCIINVRFAYYREPTDHTSLCFDAMPDDLRNLAAKVIQQCVTLQGGIGGFGTLGIANLLNYAAQGFTPYNVIGFPGSTIFLTVSVRERQTKTSDPGSTDPSIALALTQVALGASRLGNPYRGISASQVWAAQAAKMSRDSAQQTQTWYETSSSLTDQMNYECDAGLGSPSVVDCTQIEWNQLNPPSDTLAIDPGVTRFFHSNTCYLAISAAVSIVLTWAQIRTAVSTLMNACLRTPNHVAQGGRAHYSPPHQISRKKRVKRQTDLTGLNALPPSVNFTIFEQHETWINPITELKSCTWEAILRDSSVSACLAP